MKYPTGSYKHYRFPPQVITHAMWLYLRFPLSLVEQMLLERGIVVSHETIRRGGKKFGLDYARRFAATIFGETSARVVLDGMPYF